VARKLCVKTEVSFSVKTNQYVVDQSGKVADKRNFAA